MKRNIYIHNIYIYNIYLIIYHRKMKNENGFRYFIKFKAFDNLDFVIYCQNHFWRIFKHFVTF